MKFRVSSFGFLVLLLWATAAAAFPVVDNTCTSLTSSASTSHSACLPSGIAADKLLIVVFSAQGNQTLTWPAGWTALCTRTNQASNVTGETRYRIAAGSEGATISITTSGSVRTAHQGYLISAWDKATAPSCATPSAANGSNPDPPSLTPAWGAADNLWLVPLTIRGDGAPSVDPTNYANGLENRTGSTTSDAAVRTVTRTVNASTENPGAFTMAGAAYVVSTVAVKPGTHGITASNFFPRRANRGG